MAHMKHAVCSIIPPHMLVGITNSSLAPQHCRDAARHTLTLIDEIRARRRTHQGPSDGHQGPSNSHQGPSNSHQGPSNSHQGPSNSHQGPPHAQGIVPLSICEGVANNKDLPQHVRDSARNTWTQTKEILAQRHQAKVTRHEEDTRCWGDEPASTITLNRKIYSCNNTTRLPGTSIRSEGQKPIGTRDATGDADECYDAFAATYVFYKTILKRNSIDNRGLPLVGSVHYSNRYNNAMWDGRQMIFGDGDGVLFNGFTDRLEVVGHEQAHGVTQYTAGLEYEGESGALNESISDVFGSMIKQYKLKQTSANANWLIGEGILAEGINGVALRSMKAPGTAYDDPQLGGKDPQPDNYETIVITTSDNGGVHINSGIPNKAFYLACIALGGNSWDVAGRIWYAVLTGGELASTAQFQDFADLTVSVAGTLYGSAVQQKIVEAWAGVGITVAGGQSGGGGL